MSNIFNNKNDANLVRQYFNNFVRFYADSYAIQWSNGNGNRGWKTRHKPFSDKLLMAHLNQTYAVAAPASFYPDFYFLDFAAAALFTTQSENPSIEAIGGKI